jgi:diadenosine tetraphosphate (Ap4A) HIT family hydrolase
MDQRCPFCHLEKSRIALVNDCAMAIPDASPVAEGHILVVPKRHVSSLFDLPDDGQPAIWSLVAQVWVKLASELRRDAFNFGVNDGRQPAKRFWQTRGRAL